MELLQPEQRVGHQEVADLAAAEVEDVGAPVRLLPARRVAVLVQRRPVEATEAPRVLREVRRHPVDEDADARLVQAVHEVPELVRRAEAGRRRVVGAHLVAPGPAEGVLRDGQQLHVRVAEVGHVLDELVGELPVGEPDAPGPQVHLVGAHRRLVPRRRRPALQPVRVPPRCRRSRPRPTPCPAGCSVPKAIGSAFSRHTSSAPPHGELVGGVRRDAGDEDLPHA